MRTFIPSFALLLLSALPGLPVLAQQAIISTSMGGGPNNLPAIYANTDDPIGVALDSAGNYYFANYAQHRVFKVNTSGTLTVVAGTGISGYAGDGVPGGATNALLNGPTGIAVDASGNVYFADYNSCVIRKVDTSNTITTIAGASGLCGYNGDGNPATSFHLNDPYGIALDHSGNLYIADYGNCRVRKLVLSSNTISTYAGTGTCSYLGDGGAAASATVHNPGGVAADNAGNVYIADTLNYRVREVTVGNGIINTIAGIGTNGFSGDAGPAIAAKIGAVYAGITVDGAGTTVTIAENNNARVRQFTVGGNIITVAGKGTTSFCGDGASALQACFNGLQGVAINSSGSFYVADRNNDRIRQFTTGGNVSTVAGNGSATMPTPVDGVPPNGVVFNYPWGVWEDPSTNVFISDTSNFRVRELVQPSNVVNLFAGTGVAGDSGDNGLATQALINKPYGVGRDSAGNVYIADSINHIIRKVDAGGIITTFAGLPGLLGFTGDGGAANSAKLHTPYGVFVDSHDNVYIADSVNHVIRKVTNGIINTIAGVGTKAGYLGDGDPATTAQLSTPNGVSVDAAGNVYIADTNNCAIRKVDAVTGIITTIAGLGPSACGFTGDGSAIAEYLNHPNGVLSDANGNLFIADTNNHRVRWVDVSGNMTTFGGNGTAGYTGDGGAAFLGELYYPSGITQDAAGNFLVADQYNFRIRGISAFSAVGVSANSLAFGLGTIGTAGSPQTITLSAVGPLSITNIVTSGDFAEFDNCGSSLSNGKTCKVFVIFKPTTSGARTGTLTIQDNGFFSPSTTIRLTGTGSAISVAPNPVTFATQLSKTTSAPKAVTVANKGSSAITMGTIQLNQSTDFGISSNTCPASGQVLAAAASCTVNLVFKPQSTGLKKGALVISDSDASSPQIVGVSGTGSSNVVLSPSTVAFPAQAVGTTTPSNSAKKITLTNSTGAPVTLATPAITITGPFSKISATSCTNGLVVAAGGTCVIYVVFSPTSVGFPTGTLTVADSDATSPQAVALSGTATGVLFAPTTLNLGTSTVGHQVSSTVTITNVGSTFIYFSAWSITGTNRADFTTNAAQPPCAGALAPGAPCTFTMYFTPTIVGAESANFLVYDNSTGSPQVLPLSGTGQ